MQILVIGRDWHLRQALEHQLANRGCRYRSVAPGPDLSKRLASLRPGDMVVDIASFEAVVHGAHRGWDDVVFNDVIEVCRRNGIGVLMLSHASVFAFRERQRWKEQESPIPHSAIGRAMRVRERSVEGNPCALILRTSHVFGAGRSGLMNELLARLRDGGTVRLATEPRQTFTPTADIARVVSALIDQLGCSTTLWGTYHYQATDMLSCYDAGERLLAAAGQLWRLPAVTLEPAAQPVLEAVPQLDCRRIRDTFGIQQLPVGETLVEMLKQLKEQAP